MRVCNLGVHSKRSFRLSVFVSLIAITTVHLLFTLLVCSISMLPIDCHTSETWYPVEKT